MQRFRDPLGSREPCRVAPTALEQAFASVWLYKKGMSSMKMQLCLSVPPRRVWSRSFRRMACALILPLAAMLCACKTKGPVATVPVFETAEKQYAYAVQYRDGKNLELIGDKERLAAAREI